MRAVISRATSAISNRVQNRVAGWAWRKLALENPLGPCSVEYLWR